MRLDGIDKQILNELYKKGRESLTTLNTKIFKTDSEVMSHTGVKKRITKLEDSGILHVQGNISLNKLNYKTMFILLEMKNYEQIKKIIDYYVECPRVFLMAHITGQYNLIMGIVGQNMNVLHRYINYCGPTNKDGILHSQVLFSTDLELPMFLPINLFSKTTQESKCGNVCKTCEAFLDGKCDACGNF